MNSRTCSALLLAGVIGALVPGWPAAVPAASLVAFADVDVSAAAIRDTGRGQGASQPEGSPAERQFRAWLAAFNSGNRDKLLAFFRESFPARAAGVDNALQFREETGGFDLVKVESADATRFTGLVRERAGDQFARAEVEVEAAAPHRIVRMGIGVVPRPPEFSVARLQERDLAAALQAKVHEDAAKGMFSGAVLLGRRGKVLFSAARGTADRESGMPNTLETRFRMGSMNKMFTATAVLQLAQAGKLQLDAPIGRYITDYPNKEVATKVTVHHVLTHTGGTGDIFGPDYEKHRLELRTLNDYVQLYGQRALLFEPGSKWQYSNYGFILAGVIVERVSGQSYYDYVRDNIFKPAGMTSSGSEPEDQAVPNRAKGYMRRAGGLQPNTDTLPYRGTSAGGGYTTVGDLFRFATALVDHRLLNAKYSEMLTTGKVDTGRAAGDKYAYGFIDSVEYGARSFGHGGGAPGMNGELRIFPGSGYVVAALVNADSGASRLASWMGMRLPQ